MFCVQLASAWSAGRQNALFSSDLQCLHSLPKGARLDSNLYWGRNCKLMQHITESVEPPADVSTELKKLYALKRRGIASEVAKLVTFEGHPVVTDLIEQEITIWFIT